MGNTVGQKKQYEGWLEVGKNGWIEKEGEL